MTRARAPAGREPPGPHEQYFLLLKSAVTGIIRRVFDRKGTLDHDMTLVRLLSVQHGLANQLMARGTPGLLTS